MVTLNLSNDGYGELSLSCDSTVPTDGVDLRSVNVALTGADEDSFALTGDGTITVTGVVSPDFDATFEVDAAVDADSSTPSETVVTWNCLN